MTEVVLVGTLHSKQRDKETTNFSNYIKETITKYDIDALAEEIDIHDSVVFDISNELNIEYKIIEPNEHERIALGIDSLNQIEFAILMLFDDVESVEAKSECEKRKQQTYREREQEWLKRVKAMRGQRILVICGAAHINTFNQLLKKSNFNVIIECSLWE
ncbi:hypothetical protein [Alteromonas sp. CyTr2]|uniref:hypothetical protein n=1 Tax=Alteromonas sp. CyTr2 TaxID=2935039 RepID=UPI00248E5A54|nr:hypothetical protein [Alteromonas sp. CyTr2]